MFDYAMFTRILEIGVSPYSKNVLYVCDNKHKKRAFVNRLTDINNKLVYTINEIWDDNVLVGKHYKAYKFVK